MGRKPRNIVPVRCDAGVYRSVCLDFVSQFMAASGLTVPDLAKAAGVTRQSMHHYMVIDDMKLSVAERMVESLGHWLFLGFVPEDCSGDVAFDYDRYLEDYRQGAGNRLFFLVAEMRRRGLSREDLAGMVGISIGAVNYFFRNDDIYFSRLMDIAGALGLRLHVMVSDRYSRVSLQGGADARRQVVSMDFAGVVLKNDC